MGQDPRFGKVDREHLQDPRFGKVDSGDMKRVVEGDAEPPTDVHGPWVTVMTRNLFLGADLIPLATTAPGAPFQQAAGNLFDEVKGTDPDARMKLIARETMLARMNGSSCIWMKPAVIVSSLKGIGVAPLIMMISAPYSRR